MAQSSGDFSLFYKRTLGNLVGLSGTYVDDILRAGDPEFKIEATHLKKAKLDTKEAERIPFTFTGVEVTGDPSNRFISQKRYIQSLQLLPCDCDFQLFGSMGAKLSWVVNSRPDIACAIAFASEVTEKTFESDYVLELNKFIKHLRKISDIRLRVPKLDADSLQITIYFDASFNNRSDHKSQL